jgi:hypothetical protein
MWFKLIKTKCKKLQLTLYAIQFNKNYKKKRHVFSPNFGSNTLDV